MIIILPCLRSPLLVICFKHWRRSSVQPRAWLHGATVALDSSLTLRDLRPREGTVGMFHILPANRSPLRNPAWTGIDNLCPYFATRVTPCEGELPGASPEPPLATLRARTPPPNAPPTNRLRGTRIVRTQVQGSPEFLVSVPHGSTIDDLLARLRPALSHRVQAWICPHVKPLAPDVLLHGLLDRCPRPVVHLMPPTNHPTWLEPPSPPAPGAVLLPWRKAWLAAVQSNGNACFFSCDSTWGTGTDSSLSSGQAP